jgi:hypothetical protein
MQIDINVEQWEKVHALICVNFEPDANENVVIFAHSQKNSSSRTLREGGQ